MTNALERAVIEAARSLVHSNPYNIITSDRAAMDLGAAIRALDAADGPQEIGWHEVAAGDRIKSINNGKFYEVIGVIALERGRRQITIDLAGSLKAIVRPSEKEPRAIVRRGPDGRAVQTFVNVFSSGGA